MKASSAESEGKDIRGDVWNTVEDRVVLQLKTEAIRLECQISLKMMD